MSHLSNQLGHDPIDLTDGSYIFNASLISVNGVIDQNTQNNEAATSFDIGGNEYITQQITLELLTDDYAEETSRSFFCIIISQ